MKIAVLKQHQPHAPLLSTLLGPGFEVSGVSEPEDLQGVDVLVTTHLNAQQARSTQAKFIHVPGAGFDGIAWAELPTDCVGANVFCHEIPIAEYVLSTMLGHVLKPHAPSRLTAQTWASAYLDRPFRGELYGQRLTVVGTGHIGREIAKRAKAFGLDVLGVNRSGRCADGFDKTISVDRLDEHLPDTDILVLCCPLDNATRGLINRFRLSLLPQHSLLINVARGEVIEPQALFDALRARQLGGAVLDVWYQYPKTKDDLIAPADCPFAELDNVVMTPHISGWSHGLLQRRYEGIAANIKRFKAGDPLLNQIWPAT